MFVDLEMYMGTSGAPGVAHQRDRLTLAHYIPRLNQAFPVVAIARDKAIAMINFDRAAEAGPGTR